LDLEVVKHAIDFVFVEMVMKVLDLDIEVELVEHVVVEKHDKAVDIEDIDDIFHKDFSILVPKVEANIAKSWVQSNCFVMFVQMLE